MKTPAEIKALIKPNYWLQAREKLIEIIDAKLCDEATNYYYTKEDIGISIFIHTSEISEWVDKIERPCDRNIGDIYEAVYSDVKYKYQKGGWRYVSFSIDRNASAQFTFYL